MSQYIYSADIYNAQSAYIASQILGLSNEPIRYPAIPNQVFTLPRIAQVGATVEDAEQSPEQYRVISIPYGVQNEWIDNQSWI